MFDPSNLITGDGAIVTNRELGIGAITDGTSNTLLYGEVKAYTPYFRNAGIDGEIPIPNDPNTVVSMGGDFKSSSGPVSYTHLTLPTICSV